MELFWTISGFLIFICWLLWLIATAGIFTFTQALLLPELIFSFSSPPSFKFSDK